MATGFLFQFAFVIRMIASLREAKELKELCEMQEYLTDVQVMKESYLIGKKLDYKKLTGR